MTIEDKKNILDKYKFHVKYGPGKNLHWILTIIIIIVLLSLLELISSILLSLINFTPIEIPYISIIDFILRLNIGHILIFYLIAVIGSFELWHRMSMLLSRKLLLENFKRTEKSKIFQFIAWLLGLKILKHNYYFIEAEVDNIDLSLKNYPKILIKRIYEIILISFGVVFIIIYVLNLFIDISVQNNAILLFNVMFILLIFSPLLISWIVPLNWIIKDAKIKYLDDKKNVINLSADVSKSSFNRVLSYTGLFFAISFFIDYNSTLKIPIIPNTIIALYAILIFMLIISISSVAIGINYLAIFHEKNVNSVRINLLESDVKIGTIEPKWLTDEVEMQYKELMSVKKPSMVPISFKLITIGILAVMLYLYISSFFVTYPELFLFLFFLFFIIFVIFGVISIKILKKREKKTFNNYSSVDHYISNSYYTHNLF